jgi:hypothetical protein
MSPIAKEDPTAPKTRNAIDHGVRFACAKLSGARSAS